MTSIVRRIVKIDRDKCNGCGLCVAACHEGAIGLEGGRAVLLRDDYCDGLGDCLPACPTGAISFEEREALSYDEAAVEANMRAAREQAENSGASSPDKKDLPCGCPGSMSRRLEPIRPAGNANTPQPGVEAASGGQPSALRQWPVQIKLVPINAPYLQGADLLIAADCTAYAHGDFHDRFIRGRVTLIGCPKLDDGDYYDKLLAILKANDVRSVTVTRMSVPCCGGLERAVVRAVEDSGKMIPLKVVTITPEGQVVA